MQDYQDKVAVITGAGRGIGRGIALRCAKEGMKVVLAGIGMESLEKTNADLKALGAKTLVVQTDVSKEEDAQHLAEKSFATFGSVHLLVNNAGVASPATILGSTLGDWNWVMGVNFYGVLHGVRAFVPKMLEQPEAYVVNVSSVSGVMFGGGSYGVSKHAVVTLTESLYNELAMMNSKINVSVLCPGWVSTEFDTVERSRPARFGESSSAKFLSEERKQGWREALEGGMPPEELADILFRGMADKRLYIGLQAFADKIDGLHEALRERIENMIQEKNPEKPKPT